MKKGKYLGFVYCITIFGFLVLTSWGNRAVTVLVETMPISREHRIIIDPGHGGEDGGATSYTGELESGYNLAISLKLRDLFHLLGYETKLIRTEDLSVYTKGETIAQRKVSDLKERVRIADETENGLLLSIHQNHFPDSQYSGAQVFYAKTPGSQELGKQLQANLVQALGQKNHRQCRKSNGIYLMEHIQCPGVLIECGFLSNPSENERLKDPNYQTKLSAIIAVTTSHFLSNT